MPPWTLHRPSRATYATLTLSPGSPLELDEEELGRLASSIWRTLEDIDWEQAEWVLLTARGRDARDHLAVGDGRHSGHAALCGRRPQYDGDWMPHPLRGPLHPLERCDVCRTCLARYDERVGSET